MNDHRLVVLEDFLAPAQASYIENLFVGQHYTGDDVTWLRRPCTSENATSISRREKDITWFGHELVDNYKSSSKFSEFILNSFSQLENLFTNEEIKVSNIYRMRANLVPPQHRLSFFNSTPLHTDNPDRHFVGIYYVNDSDGKTILHGLDAIKPKKNRLILFDGGTLHKIQYPTKGYRCVININFVKRSISDV
jgi:hypothetical protein|tara:strand:+ start:403 stop:981 length:579 start_codon:yes stop_codon:yes gene_type:complete